MTRYAAVMIVAVALGLSASPARAQSSTLKPHNVVVHINSQGSGVSSSPCDATIFGSFAAKCPSGSCSSIQYVGGKAVGSMIGGPGTTDLCVTFDNGNATGGCTPVYFGGTLSGKDPQTIAGFAAICDINKPTKSVLGGYSNNAQSGEAGSGDVQGTADNAGKLNAKLSGFEQAP